MTYEELLKTTAEKKKASLRQLNTALHGPADFLVKAEIEKDPGSVAWCFLAREFCETLANHLDELIESVGGVGSPDSYEISDIYMAYENSESNLYELLPVEAQLFTAES